MHEVPLSARGILREFCEAGILGLADYHLASRLGRRDEPDDEVLFAFALAVRELRHGSVCLPLRDAPSLKALTDVDDGQSAEVRPDLPWPEHDGWLRRIAASKMVGEDQPFTLVDGRLYLTRFHRQEEAVASALAARRELPMIPVGDALPGSGKADPHQDAAVEAALSHMTTVITGGPGTGKTHTVVRILNSLGSVSPISIALAAPTGKASTQLLDSVASQLDPAAISRPPVSGTLHKLLGLWVRSTTPAHHADNPLPYDVVVVDEVSMVALEQMSALLDAVSPRTRLILVGDPHQLFSVDAGAVLADIVANPALTQPGSVVALRTNHRSYQEIGTLATAINEGRAEDALRLVEDCTSVSWHEYDGRGITGFPQLVADVRGQAQEVLAAARDGDAAAALAAMEQHRILCAHRLGPFGVQGWAAAARELVAATEPAYGRSEHYPGKPLLITQNSADFMNGDVAVLIERDGELVAAVDHRPAPAIVPPALLDDASDLHAMTIHKAQGGQFDVVSVVLPPVGSPLATRELLYTAVTRAKSGLRIYGTREAFVEAVRTPVRRASGLASS